MTTAIATSSEVCQQCGGQLVVDNSGSMVMQICGSCGAVVNDERLVTGGEVTEGETQPHSNCSIGDISQIVKGRCADAQQRKKKRLIDAIHRMGSIACLRADDLRMCKEEAAHLAKEVKNQRLNFIAAGLVYLALKRQSPALSFRDVSQLTGVGQKPLGRTVIWLKKYASNLSPGASSLASREILHTFQESVQLMLDQLKLPKEEMLDVKRITKDLKQILHGTQKTVTNSKSLDGAFLVIALDFVYRDKPQAVSWCQQVASLVHIKMTYMKTRVMEVMGQVLSIAKNLPCLESKIKEGTVITRNMHKYLHYVLDNKSYLISLHKTTETEDDEVEPFSSDNEDTIPQLIPRQELHLPSPLHPSTRGRKRKKNQQSAGPTVGTVEEEEGCSDLDDTELNSYICTEREVRKRKHYFDKQDIT